MCYNAMEMQEILSKHPHYQEFNETGKATIAAKELSKLLPWRPQARDLRRYIENNQSFLSVAYGGLMCYAIIQYHQSCVCRETGKRIAPFVSIQGAWKVLGKEEYTKTRKG